MQAHTGLMHCGRGSVWELCLESPWNSHVNVMLVQCCLCYACFCVVFAVTFSFEALFLWRGWVSKKRVQDCVFKKRLQETCCGNMVCLTTLFKELPSLARVMCSEHSTLYLTLSCINLGMSHKMLFYICSMIYIDIECLQSCEAREKFTMLNAKDVYPRWQ